MTEFVYRYNDTKRAHILLSFILRSTDRSTEVADLLLKLKEKDMLGYDISDNELAKSHIRYLSGGSAQVSDERLVRFGKHFSW